MRKSRLRKYKSKYQRFLFIAKVAMIWYLFVFSTSYLTSETSALFTSYVETKGEIQSSYWDPPKLKFLGNGTVTIYLCDVEVEISATIKNDGGAMMEKGNFEIYYSSNGNPEKQGQLQSEGEIPVLNKGKKTDLVYIVSEPGAYVFKASADNENYVWSGKILVKEHPNVHPSCSKSNTINQEEKMSDLNYRETEKDEDINMQQESTEDAVTVDENKEEKNKEIKEETEIIEPTQQTEKMEDQSTDGIIESKQSVEEREPVDKNTEIEQKIQEAITIQEENKEGEEQ